MRGKYFDGVLIFNWINFYFVQNLILRRPKISQGFKQIMNRDKQFNEIHFMKYLSNKDTLDGI